MTTISHFSLAQYDRMIAAGVFDGRERQRLEFIHGEIREMNPIGSQHEVIVDRLAEWSFSNLPKGKVLGANSELNRLALAGKCAGARSGLGGAVRDYSRGRPLAEYVLLVVEVADSSLAFDAGEKADLYAAAGIADYWVVNVAAHSIEVHRQPEAGRYQSVIDFSGQDELRPLLMPQVSLRPASLWSEA